MSYKAEFANYTCKLLFEKYNGDFENTEFISEAYKLHEYFQENVRNIYEEKDYIPLFYYVDYHSCTSPDDIYDEDFIGLSLPEILNILSNRCKEKYRK